MRPSDLVTTLELAIQAKQPVYIEGPPGIGKSSIPKQVAEKLGIQFFDFRAAYHDQVDLIGAMTVKDGLTYFNPPALFPHEGKGIWVFDEITSARREVQCCCYQLFLEGKIEDYTLPDGWNVICIGNREIDNTVHYKMPSPLQNRLLKIELDVNHDDWIEWAFKNNIRSEVISWIRFRPDALFQFEPKKKCKNFPSPRSNEKVSRILDQNPPNRLLCEILSGLIGEETAVEFVAFIDNKVQKIPDPKLLLEKPDTFKMITDPGMLHALCGSLIAIVEEHQVSNYCKIVNKIAKEKGKTFIEFSVILTKDIIRKFPKEVILCDEFKSWMKENEEFLDVE